MYKGFCSQQHWEEEAPAHRRWPDHLLVLAVCCKAAQSMGSPAHRPRGSRTSQFSVTICTSWPLRGSRSLTFTSSFPPVGFLPSRTSTISLISHSFSSRSSFRCAVPTSLSLLKKEPLWKISNLIPLLWITLLKPRWFRLMFSLKS